METLVQEEIVQPREDQTATMADDWLAQADELATRLKATTAASAEVRFAIGDWLNRYADRDDVYTVGEKKFKKPRKQLVDYASTARRVPEAARTFGLSFNHYRVVANTAQPDKFSHWLEYAENFHPSCEDLRTTIIAEAGPTKRISVGLPVEVYDLLESFANTNKTTLQELAGIWLQEKVKAELAIKLNDKGPNPWTRWAQFSQAERQSKPSSTVHTVTVDTVAVQPVEETDAKEKQAKKAARDEEVAARCKAYVKAKQEGKSHDEAQEAANTAGLEVRSKQHSAHRADIATVETEFTQEVEELESPYCV
jgi:hypothetical protein